MVFKHNIKQRHKTIQGLRSFKDTLPTNIKKIIKKKGYIYSETLDNWRKIVGSELFKICQFCKDLCINVPCVYFQQDSYRSLRSFQ